MKLLGVSGLAFVSVVALFTRLSLAQTSTTPSLLDLPSCALPCIISAASQSKCPLGDQACLCRDQTFETTASACILSNCTIKETLRSKNITERVCQNPVRDRQALYTTLSTTFAALSGTFIVIRLAFKLFITRTALTADDYFVSATWLAGLPVTVINVKGFAANGIGRDVWTLSFDQITNFGRFFYVVEILYFLDVTLLKMSLLTFFLRIFPSVGVCRVIWGTIVFNALFGGVFVIVAIFQCSPISFYWTKWDNEHSGRCVDINGVAWANAGISIGLDFWMLAIPLSQLNGLNLHWKKKIGVGLMFCVGTFVTVVSVLRLQSLVTFANSLNPTWDNFDVANWSTLELNIGIMCACMPSLRLVLGRLFPRLMGSTNQKYGHSGNSGNNNSALGAVRYGGASDALSDQTEPYANKTARTGNWGSKPFHTRQIPGDEGRFVRMDELPEEPESTRQHKIHDWVDTSSR